MKEWTAVAILNSLAPTTRLENNSINYLIGNKWLTAECLWE